MTARSPRPSRWIDRRHIRRVVIFFALGVVASLLQAALLFAVDLTHPMQTWQSGFTRTGDGLEVRVAWQGNPIYERLSVERRELYVEWRVAAGFGPDVEVLPGRELPHHRQRLPRWLDAPRSYERIVVMGAYGWPARSVYQERRDAGGTSTYRGTVRMRVRGADIEIPVGIIWSGLMINAIVFGSALFLIVSVDRWLVSFVRLRRQQCSNCEYDIRGLRDPVCPECGQTLPAPARRL